MITNFLQSYGGRFFVFAVFVLFKAVLLAFVFSVFDVKNFFLLQCWRCLAVLVVCLVWSLEKWLLKWCKMLIFKALKFVYNVNFYYLCNNKRG